MPRKTRAAAKAEEAVLADTDAPHELPLPPTPKHDREPLRSITPNSVDSLDNERVGVEEMAKGKGKKGKKAAAKKKGRKAKADPVEDENKEAIEEPVPDIELSTDAEIEKPEQEPVVVDEEPEADPIEKPVEAERPASSLGRSTRMTRRQQAKLEAAEEVVEPKAIAGELVLSPPEPEEQVELQAEPVPTILEQSQATEALSPLLQELPDRTRPEPLSLVASNATSRRSSQAMQDPIEAIDALEDEIDEVNKIIPSLDSPTSPVKPRATAKVEEVKLLKPASATAAKTAAARTNKLATTSQPSATARIRSLAEPKKPATLSRSSSIRARPTSVVIDSKSKDRQAEDAREGGNTADYLTSKRRPISMQFPAPPPPPKSKKAPTTSNFVLPGEAIAAKLKAQRAERQKREEEEAAKKREFKARPVSIIKTKPVEVKQTAASRARQGITGEAEKENNTGLKRSATVTGATTTAASKRNSLMASKRSSVIGAPRPAATATGTTNTALKRSSLIISKPLNPTKPRPTPNSTASSERVPSSSSNPASRNVSASEAAVQRLKGKEVYNRDNVEKKAREKAQREKDEAIKRARAEAAERGRQASREWAEKQRRIALEKKMKDQTVSGDASSVGSGKVAISA